MAAETLKVSDILQTHYLVDGLIFMGEPTRLKDLANAAKEGGVTRVPLTLDELVETLKKTGVKSVSDEVLRLFGLDQLELSLLVDLRRTNNLPVVIVGHPKGQELAEGADPLDSAVATMVLNRSISNEDKSVYQYGLGLAGRALDNNGDTRVVAVQYNLSSSRPSCYWFNVGLTVTERELIPVKRGFLYGILASKPAPTVGEVRKGFHPAAALITDAMTVGPSLVVDAFNPKGKSSHLPCDSGIGAVGRPQLTAAVETTDLLHTMTCRGTDGSALWSLAVPRYLTPSLPATES